MPDEHEKSLSLADQRLALSIQDGITGTVIYACTGLAFVLLWLGAPAALAVGATTIGYAALTMVRQVRHIRRHRARRRRDGL